jgi:hypothetical protein
MQLKDIIKNGGPEEFRDNLSFLIGRLRAIGEFLYKRTDLGSGCRVYPGIADATARQLELLQCFFEEPIEITANICRTIFEINVVFRYCLSLPQRLDDYMTQAATDEISIYKSIKELNVTDPDPNILATLNTHIDQIRKTVQKHGKTLKPDRPSFYEMAKEVGLNNEYSALYGTYSKYVHASAWLVLRKREHIDLPVFRFTMQVNAQLYAANTLKLLEDIRDKIE